MILHQNKKKVNDMSKQHNVIELASIEQIGGGIIGWELQDNSLQILSIDV